MLKNYILMLITTAAVFTLFAAVAFADSMETHDMLTLLILSGGWLLLFYKANAT